MTLAACASEPGGLFGAVQEGDLYRPADAGPSGERLPVDWPGGYRFEPVHGLAVIELV